MIIPDINLLVYAYDSSSRRHKAAREWWEAFCRTGPGLSPMGLTINIRRR